MRRTGHIRERSPGSFELRYNLGSDPATGKRKVVTTTVRGTRKEADKELRRLLRTIDTGEHVDPSRLLMRDWLSQWLDAVRPEVSPVTYDVYGKFVRQYLAPPSAMCRSQSSARRTFRGRTASGPLVAGAMAGRDRWRPPAAASSIRSYARR